MSKGLKAVFMQESLSNNKELYMELLNKYMWL